MTRNVAFAGNTDTLPVTWFADLKFWAAFVTQDDAKYRCIFGVQDPNEVDDLDVAVEINMARKGIDKLCGGLFVRSNHETTYLAHSGLVGGGTPGVGKIAFMKYYGNEEVDTIDWPDGKVSDYIIIGALDSSDLRGHVAAFAHKVAQFRSDVKKARKK